MAALACTLFSITAPSFLPHLQYAQVGAVIQEALAAYHEDVTSKQFPSDRYSPYKLPKDEQVRFV